jgi:hypothetical protein
MRTSNPTNFFFFFFPFFPFSSLHGMHVPNSHIPFVFSKALFSLCVLFVDAAEFISTFCHYMDKFMEIIYGNFRATKYV